MRAGWLPLLILSVACATAQSDEVRAGAKIFRSHCAECHGVNGEGGRGPSLTTGVFYHGSTDADLFRNITDGIPGTAMPGVFFSDHQVRHIVAYVKSLSRGETAVAKGNAGRGAEVFRQQGCGGCHMIAGSGGITGPDLTVIGSQRSLAHLRQAVVEPDAKVLSEHWWAKITTSDGAAYSGTILNQDTYTVQILDSQKGLKSFPLQQTRQFEVMKTSPMPSYKDKLNATELDDLIAYLSSLKRGGTQ